MDNFTSSTNTSNSTAQPVVSEVKLAMYGVLLVWTLLGNILVIAVVFYNENLRTHFNHLIVNMAISDLFVPLIAIPLQIGRHAGLAFNAWLIGGLLGKILCRLCYFLADIGASVSIFSLVVITVRRFVAIVFPLHLELGNALNKKNKYLIGLTWLMAMALYSPNLYYMKHTKKEDGTFKCCLTIVDILKASAHVYQTFLLASFFIPFTIIAILYSIMIYKLYKRSRNVQGFMDGELARRRQRTNRQTFILSTIIVLGCAITLGPAYSFMGVYSYIWRYKYPPYVTEEQLLNIVFIVLYLAHSNAAINTCIYFIFVKSFRQGLKRLLCCKKYPRRNTTYRIVTRTLSRSTTKTSTIKTDDNGGAQMKMDCLDPTELNEKF